MLFVAFPTADFYSRSGQHCWLGVPVNCIRLTFLSEAGIFNVPYFQCQPLLIITNALLGALIGLLIFLSQIRNQR